MHVSFEDDRGGNSVDTTGTCGSNLHSAWDTCLLQQAVGTDVAAAVDQLTGEVVSADTWAWVQSTPVDWANESFAISIADPTDYCDLAGATCEYEPGNVQFDPGESERVVTIDADLHRDEHADHPRSAEAGGVRLAHLLDEALAP